MLVLVALVSFLLGQFGSDRTVIYNPKDELALTNNSLISRFNQTEEKRAKPGGIFKISNEEWLFLKLAATGKEILYYLPKNGEIRSAEIRGLADNVLKSSLITQIRPNFKNIAWSPDDKEIIASGPDTAFYYDLLSGKSKRLTLGVRNPVFAKTAGKIAYFYYSASAGESKISLADPKIESYKNLLKTRLHDWAISWLDARTLGLISNPELANFSEIFILDTETGQLQKIMEAAASLSVNWAPSGKGFIYSARDQSDNLIKLHFQDLTSGQSVELGNKLSASRCVWGSAGLLIYCFSDDNIISINIAQPAANPKTVASDPLLSQAINPVLIPAENYLIFKDSTTNKIYGIYLNPASD